MKLVAYENSNSLAYVFSPLVLEPRVENFGSGSVHWIKVTVTPTNSNVFNFEPMIVKGN